MALDFAERALRAEVLIAKLEAVRKAYADRRRTQSDYPPFPELEP